jgi:hypothetical protein
MGKMFFEAVYWISPWQFTITYGPVRQLTTILAQMLKLNLWWNDECQGAPAFSSIRPCDGECLLHSLWMLPHQPTVRVKR